MLHCFYTCSRQCKSYYWTQRRSLHHVAGIVYVHCWRKKWVMRTWSDLHRLRIPNPDSRTVSEGPQLVFVQEWYLFQGSYIYIYILTPWKNTWNKNRGLHCGAQSGHDLLCLPGLPCSLPSGMICSVKCVPLTLKKSVCLQGKVFWLCTVK